MIKLLILESMRSRTVTTNKTARLNHEVENRTLQTTRHCYFHGPKEVVLDEETVGTQYVLLLVRTFLDPKDEKDVKAAHAVLDAYFFNSVTKNK